MASRHLFVMDPIDKINPSTDSTYDVMLECQSRGHEIWACAIEDLVLESGTCFALCLQLKVHPVTRIEQKPFEALSSSRESLADFTLIWMRKDPPVDNNFIAALYLLGSAKAKGARVVNDPAGLLVANEKLWPLSVAPELMPQTVVSSRSKVLIEAAHRFKKGVVKPLYESGGAGVMVFDSSDKNLKSAIDLLTHQGSRPALFQKFIEGAEKGDKRIILVGGDPVGGVLRVPGADDHRANLHVGGTAQKSSLSERELEICRHLKPLLLNLGLHFVGIDVINGYLTEVNVTSPTGLQEIDRLNGYNGKERLRAKLVDYLLSQE